ncbi:response regulator transcription factor [Lysobacter claricitrinus]|uniref:response regulator transcription factor n=1 Tax=Lysobacter claricitrinus TaxID=3367728 RepID=UPI0037DB9E11
MTTTAAGLRVLLIEDQHDIAANIWDYLERRGHVVDRCADGVSGLQRALGESFDVIVLDLGLPRLDGLDLCRQLRAAGRGVPVLMLTARDTLDDKLRGYAEGADDYMVKPFAMRELEARLRVIHRGIAGVPQAHGVGGLRYDAATMMASRDGRSIALTRLQGRLLDTLLRESPRVVPHARLIDAAWQDEAGDIAALHTQMYELRALVDKPFDAPVIRSVRGIGYRAVAE